MWVISEVSCMVAALCSASYERTQITCGIRGTIASEVHRLWRQLLLSYGSWKDARKFLADGHETI